MQHVQKQFLHQARLAHNYRQRVLQQTRLGNFLAMQPFQYFGYYQAVSSTTATPMRAFSSKTPPSDELEVKEAAK
jgi:hypothetical protein